MGWRLFQTAVIGGVGWAIVSAWPAGEPNALIGALFVGSIAAAVATGVASTIIDRCKCWWAGVPYRPPPPPPGMYPTLFGYMPAPPSFRRQRAIDAGTGSQQGPREQGSPIVAPGGKLLNPPDTIRPGQKHLR
jgi:hypothetical protein